MKVQLRLVTRQNTRVVHVTIDRGAYGFMPSKPLIFHVKPMSAVVILKVSCSVFRGISHGDISSIVELGRKGGCYTLVFRNMPCEYIGVSVVLRSNMEAVSGRIYVVIIYCRKLDVLQRHRILT